MNYSDLLDLKADLSNLQRLLADKESQLASFDLDEYDYTEQYKDFIDEITEPVEIMGMSFTASRILEELDPIAFACGLSDYVDSLDITNNDTYQQLEELIEELESQIDDIESQIDELENND